jgi:hypothetical protein
MVKYFHLSDNSQYDMHQTNTYLSGLYCIYKQFVILYADQSPSYTEKEVSLVLNRQKL